MLVKIPKTGTPKKFTQKHLISLGYKSQNDRKIISILKFIGFLASDGTPTEKYKEYKGTKKAVILASAIKSSYLFNQS